LCHSRHKSEEGKARMDLSETEFKEILSTLEKRTNHTRRVTLTFVSILLLLMALVIGSVLSIKIKNDNAVNQFITGVLDKDKSQTGIYLPNIPSYLEDQYKKLSNNMPIRDDINKLTRRALEPGDMVLYKKDTTETITSAIASIIVSFSILLFIGYVMRVAIVFIKYNMQLNNDYENQKIAFLISKGESKSFSQLIKTLRTQTISFDKTPGLPQERIISKLIEAISTTKSKVKEGD
jgi:predicted PurR-regulated permease PerM